MCSLFFFLLLFFFVFTRHSVCMCVYVCVWVCVFVWSELLVVEGRTCWSLFFFSAKWKQTEETEIKKQNKDNQWDGDKRLSSASCNNVCISDEKDLQRRNRA